MSSAMARKKKMIAVKYSGNTPLAQSDTAITTTEAIRIISGMASVGGG